MLFRSCNVLLTLLVIGVLMFNLMTAYVVFLLGLCVALIINYRTLKEQDGRIKAHAPAAFVIGATMISAGAMVGILNETGMMEAMARSLLGVIPPVLGGYIHMIFGVFALPLGMMIGTDAYFYGIFPLVAEVAYSSWRCYFCRCCRHRYFRWLCDEKKQIGRAHV